MVQQRGGQRGGGGGGGGRDRGDRRRRDDRSNDDMVEKVVSINRVAKVVKGGRRFSFTAVVVVGDQKGKVGVAIGHANEVPEAIRKGASVARRSMITVPLKNGTLPHPITHDFGASRVLLKPAAPRHRRHRRRGRACHPGSGRRPQRPLQITGLQQRHQRRPRHH